jgi:Protein of unknown function (DUF2975)
MSVQSATRAVTIGHRLVTLFLVVAVASGAAAIASLGVGLVRGGDSLLYGDTVSVALQLSPEQAGPLPSGVRFRGWPDVTADVKDPTAKQTLLRSAMDFGPLGLLVAGLWLLRGFARSVMEGDPFGADNVTRLRRLGFLLVVGAPLVELLNWSLRQSLYNALPPNRFGDIGVEGFELPAGALLGGLAAFILAEVFAYGLRLREDVEGTV